MAKRSTSERALIDTGRNKMSAKREAKDQFKEMDDVSRSLAVDRRGTAKTEVTSSQRRSVRPAASDEEEVATGGTQRAP